MTASEPTRTAVILAAGRGTRLGPRGEQVPKGMLELFDVPLLQWQIDTLKSCGVGTVVIVAGHCHEAIKVRGADIVLNPDFATTNSVYSLMAALERFPKSESLIVAYADLLYERRLIDALQVAQGDVCVAADSDWLPYWQARMPNWEDDLETFNTDPSGKVVSLGAPTRRAVDMAARYIGLLKFSSRGLTRLTAQFRQLHELHDRNDTPWRHSKSFRQAQMTCMLQELIDTGADVRSVLVKGGWLEFDTDTDYEAVRRWKAEGTLTRFIDLSGVGIRCWDNPLNPKFNPFIWTSPLKLGFPQDFYVLTDQLQALVEQQDYGKARPLADSLACFLAQALGEIHRVQGRCHLASHEFAHASVKMRKAAELRPTLDCRLECADTFAQDARANTGAMETESMELFLELIDEYGDVPEVYECFARFLKTEGMVHRSLMSSKKAHVLRGEDSSQLDTIVDAVETATAALPHFIFNTMPYSGSSALDPLFRELLPHYRYDLLGTNHLNQFFERFFDGPTPLYVWGHEWPKRYEPLLQRGSASRPCKFVFLYRDPRDNLVSRMKDFSAFAKHTSEHELLLHILDEQMPYACTQAQEWLNMPAELCLKIRFDEMKADLRGTVQRIFAFLGLAISPERVDEAIEKHSFEKVTNRARGENGAIIRRQYVFRKGISGEWKTHFNDEVKARFKELCGRYVTGWGFEASDNW